MGGGLDGYSWTAGIGLARLIVELSKSGIAGCTSLIPGRATGNEAKKRVKKFDKIKSIIQRLIDERGIAGCDAFAFLRVESSFPSFQEDRHYFVFFFSFLFFSIFFLTRPGRDARNSSPRRIKFFRKLARNVHFNLLQRRYYVPRFTDLIARQLDVRELEKGESNSTTSHGTLSRFR